MQLDENSDTIAELGSLVCSPGPDIGNVRETFVLNQLLNAGIGVHSANTGDFTIDELTIEVGGKGKNSSQVKHLDNYLIASDDIETGGENKVPIWLFGFLY